MHLHNFDLEVSWSATCQFTQRVIFTSFLLDVDTIRRGNVITLLRIDINEGKLKTTPFRNEISEYNHKYIDRERLFYGVEGGHVHLRLYRLPVVIG